MSALLLLLALLFAAPAAASASDPEPAVTTEAETTPAAAQPSGTPPERWSAVGTEPFWGLAVAEGRLDFDLNQTEIVYTAPAPPPEPIANGYIYRTPRLVAEVRHEDCSDGMSDRIYADTVVVTIDGRRLEGCGEAVVPPESLDRTVWRVHEVAGRNADGPYGDLFSLAFDGDTATIWGACGVFAGAYSVDGDLLTLRLAAPRPSRSAEASHDEQLAAIIQDSPACLPAELENQDRLVRILAAPVRYRLLPDLSAVLTNERGSLTLLLAEGDWRRER